MEAVVLNTLQNQVTLNTLQNRTDFFYRAVSNNLSYWHQEIKRQAGDGDTLDVKRELVVRAISFALSIEELWHPTKDLILQFSPYMERRARWTLWRTVLAHAVDVGEQVDPAGVIDLSILLTRIVFRQSDYREGVRRSRQTIRLSKKIGDKYNEARAYTNLGYHFIERGLWQRVEPLCYHALRIFEQLDSDHGRAHTENHLGILYTHREKWTKAEQHLTQACAIREAMGDESGLMQGLTNLGMLYQASKCLTDALFYSRKALDYAQRVQDQRHIGLLKLNIGVIYYSQNKLEEAKSSLYEAERIFRQIDYKYGLALMLHNLGLVYLKQNDWEKSGYYLKAGLALWQNLNFHTYEIQNLLYLTEYELARGEHAQAEIWLKQAETRLRLYDKSQRHPPLWAEVQELQHKLAERGTQPATTESLQYIKTATG